MSFKRLFFFVLGFLSGLNCFAEHARVESAPSPHSQWALPEALRCTPLEALLRKNGRTLPKNDADWESLFSKVNGTGPDIYFSTSNAVTDLLNPRRVFTAKENHKKDVNEEALYGRVFVAVGKNEEGNRVAEFITQDAKSGHYLFGTIDPTRQVPVRVDALNDCKQCHKASGPLFTFYPWTNSSANVGNSIALIRLLAVRDGEPYKKALKEIDAIIADLRKDLGPDTIEKLRDLGNVRFENQTDERSKVVEAVAKKMLDRIERSKTLRELKYQGAPVFRSLGTAYKKEEPYSHQESGAQDLHVSIENAHDTAAIAQAFEYLNQEDREKFLQEYTKASVLRKMGDFKWRKKWELGPGWHSSLLFDPGRGVDSLTTINSVDSFFTSLVIDSDAALHPILKLHEKMAKAKVHEAPTVIGIDPKNPVHFDPRGKTFHKDEEEHSSLGISDATREYFKSLIESRKAPVDEALGYALRSKWMAELYKKGVVPHSSQVKTALMKGLGEYFNLKRGDDSVLSIPATDYLSALEVGCLKYLEQPQKPGESCVRCHGSESYHYRYLNDFGLWESDLKSGGKNAKAMLSYLKKNTMPPKHTPEEFTFTGSGNQKILRAFLDAHSH